MKVKAMIEVLKDLPDDYDLCLSRFFSYEDYEHPEDSMEVILDIPITGLMKNDETKEVRFFLAGGDEYSMTNHFGDIGVKFPDGSEIKSETIN
jgi:hypothetical protein